MIALNVLLLLGFVIVASLLAVGVYIAAMLICIRIPPIGGWLQRHLFFRRAHREHEERMREIDEHNERLNSGQ